jgi:rhamnogalacturonyl hydrolase YesR
MRELTSFETQYYIAQSITVNDLKGLAAFVLASIEYEAL